jgi:hypothetical protein
MKSRIAVAAVVLLVVTFPLAKVFAKEHKSQPQVSADDCHILNGPVAEYIADTKASIGWMTDVRAHMAVKIGTDAAHLSQTVEAVERDHGRTHHASLTGLKPNTQYFFQVVLGPDPVEEVGTFRTLSPGASAEISRAIVP